MADMQGIKKARKDACAGAGARERERDSKQSLNILYHEMIGNDRK